MVDEEEEEEDVAVPSMRPPRVRDAALEVGRPDDEEEEEEDDDDDDDAVGVAAVAVLPMVAREGVTG